MLKNLVVAVFGMWLFSVSLLGDPYVMKIENGEIIYWEKFNEFKVLYDGFKSEDLLGQFSPINCGASQAWGPNPTTIITYRQSPGGYWGRFKGLVKVDGVEITPEKIKEKSLDIRATLQDLLR